jgi:hypothetical protein
MMMMVVVFIEFYFVDGKSCQGSRRSTFISDLGKGWCISGGRR